MTTNMDATTETFQQAQQLCATSALHAAGSVNEGRELLEELLEELGPQKFLVLLIIVLSKIESIHSANFKFGAYMARNLDGKNREERLVATSVARALTTKSQGGDYLKELDQALKHVNRANKEKLLDTITNILTETFHYIGVVDEASTLAVARHYTLLFASWT
jgi:hypothetical protein